MFKTIFHISFAFCFALAASRSNAQQASQPLFTISNGFDTNQGSSRGNASLSLPVLGFVLDQAGGLRPLVGIAGSASVGAPVALGVGIVRAAIPPSHDYILAVTPDSNWPLLLHVSGNTITVGTGNVFFNNRSAQTNGCYADSLEDSGRFRCRGRGGTDLSPRIDRIALSATGSAAALFSESNGRIYAFSNLSHSPRSLGTFEVGALGTVSTFGISDDGRTIIFGITNGSVYLVDSLQEPRLIASMHHPSAIQFLRNSGGAIIADDIDNTIYAFLGGQIYPIAGSADGIAGPVGVAVSNDNQKVFVGNSGTGSVTTIGLGGTGTQSAACNCALAELQPTSVDSVFELTGFSGGSISLFDGNSATPRTILVPVGAQF